MAETTRNDKAQNGADLAAAVRDRGMEQIEGAKGQLAEGAERVAAAVERTADDLEGEGDNAISGFGHSVASLMRQLAGGLRERDIEEFARELAALARRNPGVFLAGSVALGFGIARFFKAGTSQSSEMRQADRGWQSSQGPTRGGRGYAAEEYDAEEYEERLDLSASTTPQGDTSKSEQSRSSASQGTSATRDAEQDSNPSKSRQSGKQKVKPQRASGGGSQSPSSDLPPTSSTAATTDSDESGFTDGTGGGALRGGKS
ncbi:MAG TPA: hypothetical protein VNA66_09495 [Gammaproteobacteria bacterium]|jgi:hypothetical protein|nr:hypothetical protein [Gammaproteobacteria bacterium]